MMKMNKNYEDYEDYEDDMSFLIGIRESVVCGMRGWMWM